MNIELRGKINDKIISTEDRSDGLFGRLRLTFSNGYGISIIQSPYSHGGADGLFEIAVLKGDRLCYDTPVTDDVVGYLNPSEVLEYAERIASL